MPIEIKELHIKAIVGGNAKEQARAVLKPEDIAKLKKEISREVTDKILRLIQRKNER
jgi:hypothetical protein